MESANRVPFCFSRFRQRPPIAGSHMIAPSRARSSRTSRRKDWTSFNTGDASSAWPLARPSWKGCASRGRCGVAGIPSCAGTPQTWRSARTRTRSARATRDRFLGHFGADIQHGGIIRASLQLPYHDADLPRVAAPAWVLQRARIHDGAWAQQRRDHVNRTRLRQS